MYKQSLFSFVMRIIRIAMHTTRAGDCFIVVLSLFCVVALVIFAWWANGAQGKPYVEITTSRGTFLYQLEQQRTISIDGPLGVTVVVIDKKGIDVTQSPGPRQICVNAKPISQHGQWLACLPNRVFLRIYGKKTQENLIDGLSF